METMTDHYAHLFKSTRYATHSNTIERYQYVTSIVKKYGNPDWTIMDMGAGRGNICRIFSTHKVTNVDLCNFAKHPDFLQCDFAGDLSELNNLKVNVSVCLDVLEHVDVDTATRLLYKMKDISEFVVLTIANHSDVLLGKELHLIQEGVEFWNDTIKNCQFNIIESHTKSFSRNNAEVYYYFLS